MKKLHKDFKPIIVCSLLLTLIPLLSFIALVQNADWRSVLYIFHLFIFNSFHFIEAYFDRSFEICNIAKFVKQQPQKSLIN